MEEIKIQAETKEEQYTELLPQIFSLLETEDDCIANMANIVASLKQTFSYYSWVGFYLLKNNELVLGPFQGKVACTRLTIGKGVCGSSVAKNETIIVPNVEKFPGHIYCDGNTKSEIVLPLKYKNTVCGVLDVDSYKYNSFDEVDKMYLETLLEKTIPKIIWQR